MTRWLSRITLFLLIALSLLLSIAAWSIEFLSAGSQV